MKSLILAMVFFAVLFYGCYDVKPFRAIRKIVRRPGKRGSAPIRHEVEPPPHPMDPPPMRRVR